jgi:hypothetical protein
MSKHTILAVGAALVAVALLIWYFVTQKGAVSVAPTTDVVRGTVMHIEPFFVGEQVVPVAISHEQQIEADAAAALTAYNQQIADTNLYNMTLANLVAKQSADAAAITAADKARADAAAYADHVAAVKAGTAFDYAIDPVGYLNSRGTFQDAEGNWYAKDWVPGVGYV